MKLDIITIADRSKSDIDTLIHLGGWTAENFGYWVDHIAFTMRSEIRKILRIKESAQWTDGTIPQHTKSGLELRLQSAQDHYDAAFLVLDTIKWKRPVMNRPTTKKDLNELFSSVVNEVSE